MNRCDTIVTEEEDREKEKEHVCKALAGCGYPPWALKKDQQKVERRKSAKKKNLSEQKRGLVVIPYVQGISEKVERTLKKYNITTAMKPYLTLRNILVHPKDKCTVEEQGEVVYKIPCKNCERSYIGETGRLFRTRLEEHKKDVESNTKTKYTRSQRQISQDTIHKSALTDHATTENHEIDWDNIKIVDKESQRRKRHVKEAIWIKRTKGAINRDEGNYQLSHLYEGVIHSGSQLH